MPYVRDIPFDSGSDTSYAAAVSQLERSDRDEYRVYEAITHSGLRGMNDSEIETQLGMLHQTASARRRGLVLKGLIVDSGRRRETRSGRTAVVWISVRFAVRGADAG